MEKACNLGVHVLNWLLLALVCLENFQELLVYLGFILETILSLAVSSRDKSIKKTDREVGLPGNPSRSLKSSFLFCFFVFIVIFGGKVVETEG